ncbi:hypothetical protein APSETT445_005429 [Aspergillus pseudonomiae]
MATQCPAENCNGDRAYFFQLQIRSADEPMTTFLKIVTAQEGQQLILPKETSQESETVKDSSQ